MGLLKDLKKQLPFEVDLKILLLNDNETKYVTETGLGGSIKKLTSNPYTVRKSYGSGGWIEGYRDETQYKTFRLVYNDLNEFIGLIYEYNVCFKNDHRYHVIVCEESDILEYIANYHTNKRKFF